MYFGHGYGLDIEIPFNDSSFLKLMVNVIFQTFQIVYLVQYESFRMSNILERLTSIAFCERFMTVAELVETLMNGERLLRDSLAL